MSRKFRWMFEATFPAATIPATFVRVNARPNSMTAEIKEPEIPTSLKPMGGKWEPITTIFLDQTPQELEPLFKILTYFYEFDIETKSSKEIKPEMLGEVKLQLLLPRYIPAAMPPAPADKPKTKHSMGIGSLGYMGFGKFDGWEVFEEWTLKNALPKSCRFGELDHSSSELCTIEIDWMYNEAIYKSNTPKLGSQ